MAQYNTHGEQIQCLPIQNRWCRLCLESEQRQAASVRYCINCRGWLCEPCCEQHRKFPQLQHHQMTQNVSSTWVRFSPCSTHPGLEQSYFCVQCSLPMCAECRLEKGGHWQHKAKSIDSIINEKISSVEEKKRNVDRNLLQMRSAIEMLESTRQEVKEKKERALRKIGDQHKLMQEVLQQVQSQLVESVTRTFNAHLAHVQQLLASQLASRASLQQLGEQIDDALSTRLVLSVLELDTKQVPAVPPTPELPETPCCDVDVVYTSSLAQVIQGLLAQVTKPPLESTSTATDTDVDAAASYGRAPEEPSKTQSSEPLSPGPAASYGSEVERSTKRSSELSLGPGFYESNIKEPQSFSDIAEPEISVLKGDWVRAAKPHMRKAIISSHRLPVLHGPPSCDRTDYKVVSRQVAIFLRHRFGSIQDQPLPLLSKRFFTPGSIYIVLQAVVKSKGDIPQNVLCNEVRLYAGGYRFPATRKVFLGDLSEINVSDGVPTIKDIFIRYNLRNYDKFYVTL